MHFLWIVAMGLSQEPHNKLVMMFECSSVLSGYPGHLGNFLIIVVKFFTRVWLVSTCNSVCVHVPISLFIPDRFSVSYLASIKSFCPRLACFRWQFLFW